MMVGMSDDAIDPDHRRAAADLLNNLLGALPPAGPRDVGLRSAVEQRAEALRDLADHEGGPA